MNDKLKDIAQPLQEFFIECFHDDRTLSNFKNYMLDEFLVKHLDDLLSSDSNSNAMMTLKIDHLM